MPFRLIAFSVGLFFAAFFIAGGAFSKTIVKKTGECTREVIIQIQIRSGGPRWTDAELNAMPEKQRKRLKNLMDNYTNYTDAQLKDIAKEWKAEIENLWNGPTWDQLKGAQEELGISDADVDKVVQDGKGREDIVKKLTDHLKKFGGGDSSCAEINCCKIYFKADVKIKKAGESGDSDYHQILVMKKGWRSSITTHDEGLEGNHKGTFGKLGYDPNNPQDASAGHETGHLMGLDDQYTDAGGTKEGHQHDIMDWSYGFPQEDALERILKIGGAECDCCPRPDDDYFVRFNRTWLVASDAILTKNCPILKQTLADLEDQLSNVSQSKASITARVTLTARLKDQIAKVKKALEDCDDPEDQIITGIPGVPFTFDSNVCQFYGGGTINLPVTPLGPFIPVGPETPGTTPPTGPGTTPPTGPGTTPPGEPGTTPPTEPGTTPPTTPGTPGTIPPERPIIPVTPGGVFNPDLINPLPLDTIIERVPGDGEDTPSGGTVTVPIEITNLDLTTTEPVDIPIEIEDDEFTPPSPVMIVKAEQDVIEGNQIKTKPVEGSVLKLGFPPPELPNTGTVRTAENTDKDHDKEPRHVVTDENGIGVIRADGLGEPGKVTTVDRDKIQYDPETGLVTGWEDTIRTPGLPPVTGIRLDMTPTKSGIIYVDDPSPVSTGSGPPNDTLKVSNIGSSGNDGILQEIPDPVRPYITDGLKFGDTWGLTFTYPLHQEDSLLGQLEGYEVEENHYRDKQADDPYYNSRGSWNQDYDDQWAIKHVGFTEDGAWALAGDQLAPVVVAVIDTGLDWNHADISWDNIWKNEDEIPDNGIDDDMNGYIDDVIGWDFYANSNKPWDQDGHGTFIAGMIAAAKDNGIGIAGMNPAVKIMVLKALNDFGHSRASFLAKAIKYAADNGADVINLSVGGQHLTRLEKMAVEYAHERGVVIVVASGNDGTPVSDYGLSPYEEVIAVGSTDLDDKRAIFSNWGAEVDIAAPGIDVMSLRARRTDFMRHIRNVEYEAGSAYLGEDKRYYRSSGTSFSAPIVSGLASLILSKNPDLTNLEVKRMILQSARDIETPGRDQYTGYGLVDAVAALKADPNFEILADIAAIEVVQQDGQTFVAVTGTAGANDFASAEISIGAGEEPESFKTVGERINRPVYGATLTLIPAEEFRTSPVWVIRLVVTHDNGQTREERFTLTLG